MNNAVVVVGSLANDQRIVWQQPYSSVELDEALHWLPTEHVVAVWLACFVFVDGLASKTVVVVVVVVGCG